MNKIIKSAIISTVCILLLTLTACSDTSKKVSISPSTQEKTLVEENIYTEVINNDKKYLNDKIYDESMVTFNKAIELDKENKDLYLEVDDSYLENDNLDDSYSITNIPITNNVNSEDINLTVDEDIYDKQIGFIKNIYNKNEKTYVDIDLVEFYFGNEISLTEALKDNTKISYKDDGTPYVPDGYYIRNNSSEITTYEVLNNCSFQLLHHDFVETLKIPTDYPNNSSINIESSFDDFINYINLRNQSIIDDVNSNSYTTLNNSSTLCWIELKNNNIYSIYRQYTP